ncbi:hypothetical protein MUG94_11585 [Arthrobacter gengyunqii]|uniref:GT-D fold-like domain-containing protein n=1 Tax=Arthrobacter gengyunqii TaxID=2886940 RepID=A0A9X1LY05_9MICC|nr:hypothetical protein [Arthrobacter gengyunqii]MCC3267758.1 hypothetical protein [Arthrobacter gengyunqii]UOY95190.1 hypothetical protein MUG94_11585 [Arthrobacter gengyunqii]
MSIANFIRLHDVESLIREKWEAKAPFSLVRVGDGELSVLKFPHDVDDTRIQHVFRRAMSDRAYTDEEISAVRSGMTEAVDSADIVGMYDSYEPNELCLVHEEHLEQAELQPMTACHPSVHIFLQSSGALDRLLRVAQRVTLVTGRDILDEFKRTYPHLKVNQHLIPVERQYRLSDNGENQEQHYPDVYNRIKNELRPEGRCHLYLVGAGILGKEYCSIIKGRGGFAIDIGSVFDYWADVPTREGKQAIKDGKAVLAGESRWPGIFLGSAPAQGALERTPHRGMFRPLEIIAKP